MQSEISSETSAQTAQTATKRRGFRRLVVIVLVLALAWHGYATLAWLSGSATLMNIGPVRAYIDPAFRQNWSVFAPDPDHFNTKLQVRATLTDGTETEWYDVTEQDIESSIEGVPVLSRMYQSNFMLSWHTLNDINQVTDEERDIMRSPGETRSAEELETLLQASGAATDEGMLRRVLNENLSLTMVASEVARARWAQGDPDAVLHVQFRIRVVPIEPAPWVSEAPPAYLFDWQPGPREPVWHERINAEVFADRYGPHRDNSGRDLGDVHTFSREGVTE